MQEFLDRCVEIALLGKGNTGQNPCVGSLIIFENEIIGEGFHQKFGDPHAEVNAINSVENKDLLSKSTLFVTLEPCFHFGKTPPCVDLILKYNIPRIVIGCKDPNPKVAGKSIQKLIKNGIDVILTDHLNSQLLIQKFVFQQENKIPYVTLKWAESQDGFIGRLGEKIAISNTYSSIYVHKLRSDNQAIMVSSKTFLNDKPTLNTRNFPGNNPIIILLDADLKTENKLNHLKSNALIFNKLKSYKTENILFEKIDDEYFYNNDLFLKLLYSKYKIGSILIEGGSTLLQSFIDSNNFQKITRIQSSKILKNGIKAPILNENLNINSNFSLNSDKVIEYNNYI